MTTAAPPSPDRIVFHGRRTLAPELKMIGCARFPRAVPALQQHIHRDAYEICLIVSGAVDWWVEGHVYEVAKGQLFITRPAESHGGSHSMMQPCALYWVQVVIPQKAPLPGWSKADTATLRSSLNAMTHRVFAASDAVRGAFARLLHEHQTPNPLRRVAARAAMDELLVGVVRDQADHARAQRDRRAAISPAIQNALEWMKWHECEDYAIDDVASAAALSISHFHDRFLTEVGIPPGEYRTRQRLRLAKYLLRGGDDPITKIAVDLGFSTSQYFATTFKHFVGMTPREYRRCHVKRDE